MRLINSNVVKQHCRRSRNFSDTLKGARDIAIKTFETLCIFIMEPNFKSRYLGF